MMADAGSLQERSLLFRQASLPLSLAVLVIVGFLLLFLGILLFPVNLGLIPFSPDGQIGLLLVITAIQMMALGETPLGQFRRSWLLVIIGLVFTSMGIVSCTVPGVLTTIIRTLLGVLNITGGVLLLVKMYRPVRGEPVNQPDIPQAMIPLLTKMKQTQTLLYAISIAFGTSMLMPGLVSGFIIAAILIINGLLLFKLGFILRSVV